MAEAEIVIDADSHVMEPPDLWERYLEPRYRDRAIRIVETGGIEAGCGWAGFLMDRLDQKHGVFAEMAQRLERKPSEYLRRNFWYVAEPDERTIGAMCDIVGEDRILWGSDFPHIDSHVDAPERIRSAVRGLGDERRRRVLGANAARVFGWQPPPS
jgi:hypothetical protein